MDTDTPAADTSAWGLFTNPWPAAWVGLGALALAFLASLALGPGLAAVWVVLLLVGLAAAGAAVAIQPGNGKILFCAAGAALLAVLVAENSHWDPSAATLFWITTVVAAAAGVLMLLPRTARRVAVSLVIVFHFGGIFTAITAAPPQPWVAGQLWTYVYRPYLQFMYLNNAYHFYSPEPGPANLLWMRIEYEKDPDQPNKTYSRWVKIPNLDKEGRAIDDLPEGGQRSLPKLEFTRRLSLVESISGPGNVPPNFTTELVYKRQVAGQVNGIPPMPDRPIELQYREPNTVGKVWLSSYARHVCATYKHEQRPDKKAVRVKIYRVIHNIMLPSQYAAGRPLDDPTMYEPYYLGDYDPDGKLLSVTYQFNDRGRPEELNRDPFLYWLIPIVFAFPADRDPRQPEVNFRTAKVINYLKKHAGDADEDSQP